MNGSNGVVVAPPPGGGPSSGGGTEGIGASTKGGASGDVGDGVKPGGVKMRVGNIGSSGGAGGNPSEIPSIDRGGDGGVSCSAGSPGISVSGRLQSVS